MNYIIIVVVFIVIFILYPFVAEPAYCTSQYPYSFLQSNIILYLCGDNTSSYRTASFATKCECDYGMKFCQWYINGKTVIYIWKVSLKGKKQTLHSLKREYSGWSPSNQCEPGGDLSNGSQEWQSNSEERSWLSNTWRLYTGQELPISGHYLEEVAQMVKNLQRPGFDPWLEKIPGEMATSSSILAWKIPWTVKPGRLQSTGTQRVGHDSA